ncbi:MAG: membrane protein insertase YidC [Proteobacteria bacterium]|nr:membrane protein insertase YidC [Pseudomonadota bacterium]
MIDNKNFFLAMVLAMLILFGFEFFVKVESQPGQHAVEEAARQAQQQAQSRTPTPGAVPGAPVAGGAALPAITIPGTQPSPSGAQTKALGRANALLESPRIKIETPRLHGSIALKGGLIDDLTLVDYHETVDKKSPEIIILSPKGAEHAYFATHGWTGAADQPVPGPDTVWAADATTLRPDSPVTLSWANGKGLVFKRTISVDKNYLFTVMQSVANTTQAPVTLYPYALLTRYGTPDVTDFYILHEGLLGVLNDQLTEIKYKDIIDAKAPTSQPSKGGWIGITDKYWLAALIPNQSETVQTRFLHRKEGKVDVYQTDYLGAAVTVPAGGSAKAEGRIFTGAKEVNLLDIYSEKFGIARFDLAIDFGWFYFLTKPIFLALLWIHGVIGNLGVSILVLTVAIKTLFFPLANKSYKSMSKMKKLQPEMIKLRERFSEDKARLNQEMMALYKKEKVNPASGCLPILVQIPVFFALYKVLFVTIEMRHAPFFGWIKDLSAPDPTTLFNLFGLIPWSPPTFLMIGVWPLIMGITMFLQQRLNPQPADPIQAKIFLYMPLFFTFILAPFPAGLVVYWAWNNTLSILQQWVIMRQMGMDAKQALS